MINKFICTLMAATFALGAAAQHTDGTTKSLLKAEEEYAESVARNGIQSASLAHSSSTAIVFRPNPTNIKAYYAAHPSNDKELSWTPTSARVSRSGDWGFTTGPYTYNAEGGKVYGQYLSIWKAINGKWEQVIDIADTHSKPLHPVVNSFIDPKDYYKPQFNGPKQVSYNKEIILTTEKTLNAMLKSYGMGAYGGFLNPEAQLNFPGYEPVIGKDKIVAFYNSVISKVTLKTVDADRSSGGDFAYTYGLATIDYRTDLRESFNYVFVYERMPDHNWNLIQQIYTPAER